MRLNATPVTRNGFREIGARLCVGLRARRAMCAARLPPAVRPFRHAALGPVRPRKSVYDRAMPSPPGRPSFAPGRPQRPTKLGKWEVVAKIAGGGMATIYL